MTHQPRSDASSVAGGFTDRPWQQGLTGNQPGVTLMEATIVSGAWKGHLGRGLAPKELQYLLGTAQGKTAKEIARQFDVAACTVAKRLSCAMFKLGVTRQTAAVARRCAGRSSHRCALSWPA